MGAVYFLTLRQLGSRPRLLVLAMLSAIPVFMVLMMLRGNTAPSVSSFENFILAGVLTGSIMPLMVLAITAPAFANELEDRTLANLTLAPIARSRIVVPKLLAAVTVSAPFVAVSAFLTGEFAYLGDLRATLAVTGGAIIGVALYAVVFLFFGLLSTQAIGLGLLYIVIWEGFLAGFVSGVRLLSIRYYATALMHGLDPRRFAGEDQVGFGMALGVTVVVFGGFLYLAIRRLRRMDVP